MSPKISLVSRGASRLTGPWERSRWEDEEMARGRTVEMREMGEKEKVGDELKGVQVREEEVGRAC